MDAPTAVALSASPAARVAPPDTDGPPTALARISWVSTFSLAPVVLGLLTAMFFMTGRAYWLAYLGHFRLEPSLFSDDLSSQATRSVAAWLYAVTNVALWIRDHVTWAVVIVMGLPIAVILALCLATGACRGFWRLLAIIFGGLAASVRGAAEHPRTRTVVTILRTWFAPPPFTDFVVRGMGLAYAIAHGLYVAFWTVGLVLLILVAPFNYIGDSVALGDQANGFADAPVVTLTDTAGKTTAYRLILCAPRFCALYDGKRAVTVAASEVTRADSPPPKVVVLPISKHTP